MNGENQHRFVYHYYVPSLQELASFRVTLTIWNDVSSKSEPPTKRKCTSYSDELRYSDRCNDYEKDAVKVIKNLDTHRYVKKNLTNSLDTLCRELKKWIVHFLTEIFRAGGSSRNQFRPNDIDPSWCVWLPSGEIDYRNTGRIALNSERLNEVQKFIIMCEYCMQDRIDSFQLNSLPEDFIEQTDDFNDAIRFYWICYLKNELHKIPVVAGSSIYFQMATSILHGAEFIKEYCWHRLLDSVSERLSICAYWINLCDLEINDRILILMERLFSSLTWPQQLALFNNRFERIIVGFSLGRSTSQFAIWTWNRCKDTITLEQFAQAICDIIRKSRDLTTYFRPLIEIWNSAYDHQRNFVFETESNFLISSILWRNVHSLRMYISLMIECLDSGSVVFQRIVSPAFLCEFFRLIPSNIKKKFIFDEADLLAPSMSSIKESMFRPWVNLYNRYLLRNDDTTPLKQLFIDVLAIRERCLDLLYQQEFSECDRTLQLAFSYSYHNTARAFKQELLDEVSPRWKDITVIFDATKWNEMRDYIEKVFLNDSSYALQMQQRIITAMAANCRYNRSLRKGFDTMVTIVETIFKNEELENVKNVFSKSFYATVRELEYSWYEENCDQLLLTKFTEWISK